MMVKSSFLSTDKYPGIPVTSQLSGMATSSSNWLNYGNDSLYFFTKTYSIVGSSVSNLLKVVVSLFTSSPTCFFMNPGLIHFSLHHSALMARFNYSVAISLLHLGSYMTALLELQKYMNFCGIHFHKPRFITLWQNDIFFALL